MRGKIPMPEDKPTEQGRALYADVLDTLRPRVEQARRFSLVVHHAEGSNAAPLALGAPVIVGRRPPSRLVVLSPKLSRTHARFTLQAAGRILVEDLGSTNGTWVAGARVDGAEIAPGDVVLVGDALAVVQVSVADNPVSVITGGGPAAPPVAESPAMREALAMAARVAPASVPVVLHGETGTGKEVVARFLHAHSPRAGKPMVSVNCGAIPAQLLESTLFGHERGAFTGAQQRQKGVFEEADGGTVLLDEIGELPLPAQAALLRVLETGTFARVGSPREIAVDVRVIAATHRDLDAARAAGQFRADLYYRLNVMVIVLPALRDRVEDLEPLARRFLAQTGRAPMELSPEALARLRAHAWPGNVRELRNTIERAAILAPGPVIREDDLPLYLRGGVTAPSAPPPRARTTTLSDDEPGPGDLRAKVADYQARTIQSMLEQTGWNQSETARRLGMPIRTLANKVKALGLKRPGPAGQG